MIARCIQERGLARWGDSNAANRRAYPARSGYHP
jgi:hypothetical protein